MEPLTIEFQYTEDDAVRASMEIRKSANITRPLIRLTGIVLVVVAMVSFFIPVGDARLFVVFAFGVLLIAFPITMRRVVIKNFRKNPCANKIIRWEIHDNELRNETEGAEMRFNWDKIIKVGERKSGFLLFFNSCCAHWIPKKAFRAEKELNEFRSVIMKHGFDFKG